jgi:hypothetical protein
MDGIQRVETHSMKDHRRQFAWQILVPVIVAAIIVIAAAVFIATRGTSVTTSWADVSIIWLVLPFLFFAFVLIGILGFLIYGIARLLGIIPVYSRKTQEVLVSISMGARKVTDGSIKPIVWINQAGAVLKRVFKL